MPNFRSTLIQLSQDGVIDRLDLTRLKQTAAQARKGSDDAWTAKQVLGFLDKYREATHIRYGIPGQTLEFEFTPAYAESDLIPGESTLEKLKNVSQSDTLSETDDDHQRCGAASLINAWLLLNGSFEEVNQKLGLERSELTYGNLHRAQESLFDKSNSDGQGGLRSSYSYSYSGDAVHNVTLGGEAAEAIRVLGLKAEPLTGKTVSGFDFRKESVTSFWQKQPQGILLTGVYLDTDSGELQSPDQEHPQNHFVTIFKEGSSYYLLDTGASDNGLGNSLHELSAQQLEGFVYQSSGHVIGLSRAH